MSRASIQKIIFFAILMLTAGFLVLFEYYEWGDATLLLYGLCAFFSTSCLVFWAYWGVKSRLRPSTMFIVIGLLLASIDYVLICDFVARLKYTVDPVDYLYHISKNSWTYRRLPEYILLVWLFSWIGGRLFGRDGRSAVGEGKLRIMIVEDDEQIAKLMCQVVSEMKVYLVDVADSYSKAIALFEPNKYVCVTIDLNLGSSTQEGVDLAWKFRRDDPNVFIAVVSGYFDHIFDSRLLNSVDDFLQKPFGITVFKLKVFLWTIKYRRRIEMKQYVEGSDVRLKYDILKSIEEKLESVLNGKI